MVTEQRKRERTCGDCTACCTSMAVVELNKFSGVKCDHVCATGCAIYLTRPAECARFECLWLGDDEKLMTREEDRPDLSGVLFTFVGENIDIQDFKRRYGYPPLQAFETYPGSTDTWRAQKLLNRIRRRAIVVICHFNSTKRTIIGPDDMRTEVRERLEALATRNAQEEEDARAEGTAREFFDLRRAEGVNADRSIGRIRLGRSFLTRSK